MNNIFLKLGRYKITIYSIILLIIGLNCKVNAKVKKEVLIYKASFFIFQKKEIDTTFSNIENLFKEEKYVKALKKSLEYLNNLSEKDLINIYKTQNLIADIYDRTNNRSKSLTFYKKALKSLESSYLYLNDNNTENIFDVKYAETFHKIGSLFQKIKVIDSAKYYYNKVIELPSLNKDILDFKASTYTNLSGIYEVDSLYSIAEDFALKAIDIHKRRNNKLNEAYAINNLANIYLSQGKFEKSRVLYFEAIELINNFNSVKAINIKADLYYNLAWAMRNLKDYNAYDNLEKSYAFTEKIRDKEVSRMIETITGEYNVNQVRKEEASKRLIQEQRFWIVGGLGLLIILSLTFYVILYYQRKRTLALRLANIDYEQKQKIDAVKSESQTRVLNATIDGKETERKEIAETLHDNVSALLSSANLHLQASRKHFKGNIPIEIYKSEQIINEASEKIRDLSHTLVSSILLKFGLTFAVKDIVDKYSNSSLQIDADVDMLRRFDQKFEIKTFNIIQEILNNVLKHSKAKNAKVSIKENNGKLLISIIDDGIGFDKTKINLKDGLGINQIDARIRMMKGDFFIDSKKGLGTKVKIDLPIQEKETSISA